MHDKARSEQQGLRVAQWTAFWLTILAYMVSFFHRVAPAALSMELQQAFSATSTELGSVTAVFFFVVMSMQIPTGIIADTLGPRRLLVAGCMMAALGAFVFASAHTVGIACIGRGFIGLGAAIPFVALLRLNASWFSSRQFATLSGLTLLFGNLGSILSTTPLQMASQVVSWRLIIGGIGVLTLAAGALIALYVRDKPSDLGLAHPDGPSSTATAATRGSWVRQLLAVVTNARTWPCFWVGFGICGTFFTFTSLWAVPYLVQAVGLTKSEASTHVLVMILCHAVTALFLGRTSDRLGNRKGLLLMLAAIYLVSWLPMLGPMKTFAGESYIVFAIQGIASTSYTLIWAIAKEVNAPDSAGMAIGVTNTSMFMAAAIFQPLIGALIDRFGLQGMTYSIELLAAVSAIGLLAGLCLVETRGKNVYSQKIA
ncbi:MFS transporter [Ralstonia pseudosolanacearum]|uniref:MFS transporter n=1 Tax=Ralstonia pseudosolanacearum TaxID=1310165 RepID=UPI0018A4ABAD|nr:MFS transporter [Ralstonia pseudosolanacearum]BCL95436.1 MFS transporter [Ralstonia solanacearum]MDO3527123.1 MFS transporter [Ralstonia pseudosolanacearum]MDO3531728.1 MFS transporter [Ralstonia pseudosolanacearum]BCM00502.1 MFS transporter [Ralstonia solanacearum]BCM15964.1 MFS transporter [Ralstonia solanacearum]